MMKSTISALKNLLTLWLSTKIMLTFAIMTMLITGGILWGAAVAYRKDKVVYLYDTQDMLSERVALRLSRELAKRVKEGGTPLSVGKIDPAAVGIPRLPQGTEIFIGTITGQPALFFLDGQGKVVSKSFTGVGESLYAGRALSWWVTSFGTFLASSSAKEVNAESFVKRPIVAEFLSSGLTRGLASMEAEGAIASFREVPGTNTVVFVETSVEEAMQPLRDFIKIAGLASAFLVLLGLLLTYSLMRVLWKPVRLVTQLSRQIADGNYKVSYHYRSNDEMSLILKSLKEMAGTLELRERHLVHLRNNLEEVFHLTIGITVAKNKSEAILSVRKKISKHFGLPLADVDIRVVEPASTEIVRTTPASQMQIPVKVRDENVAYLEFQFLDPTKVSKEDVVFLDTAAVALGVCFENFDLRDAAAESARVEVEMATANAVQANLLPILEQIPDLTIATWYKAAEQVGGDWYGQYYDERNRIYYFYMGDVTGHGVASALIAAVACGAAYAFEATEGILRNGENADRSTDSVKQMENMVSVLNHAIYKTGRDRLGMTLGMLAIHLDTGKLLCVNCGHTLPFHIQQSGAVSSIMTNGYSLGWRQVVEAKSKVIQLSPGDSLLLYTDGLVENTGPDEKTLSRRALQKTLASFAGKPPQQLLDGVIRIAEELWQEETPADDVSLVVLRWKD